MRIADLVRRDDPGPERTERVDRLAEREDAGPHLAPLPARPRPARAARRSARTPASPRRRPPRRAPRPPRRPARRGRSPASRREPADPCCRAGLTPRGLDETVHREILAELRVGQAG